MDNKVSIIVPIYNVEPFIRQCLDSIIHQTYQNLEIILIDDGSPDNCGAICDEYAEMDSRIIVIHKKNAGVGAARNEGIEHATGEWVMFVDPDDWLELDCCMRVIAAVGECAVEIIYFQRQMDNENGECIKKYPVTKSFHLDQEVIKMLQLHCYYGKAEILGFQSIVPWAKLYSLKFLLANCCRFPEGLKKRQDIIFNLYCQEHLQSAYFFNYVGYHNRIRRNSTCQHYRPEILDIELLFLQEQESLLLKYHADDVRYMRSLGVLSFDILGDLEYLFFFYPQKVMSFKDYKCYMNDKYYSNAIINKYTKDCKISDFPSFLKKVRFLFISNHWLYPYYWLSRCWGMLKRKFFDIT